MDLHLYDSSLQLSVWVGNKTYWLVTLKRDDLTNLTLQQYSIKENMVLIFINNKETHVGSLICSKSHNQFSVSR